VYIGSYTHIDQTSNIKFDETPRRALSFSSSLTHPAHSSYRSYRDDFSNQYGQYETQREIFLQAPSSTTDDGIVSLRDLIDFIAHVADCYPHETTSFPQDLIHILGTHHAVLESELREKIVGSLVLLKRKDVIDSST